MHFLLSDIRNIASNDCIITLLQQHSKSNTPAQKTKPPSDLEKKFPKVNCKHFDSVLIFTVFAVDKIVCK